MTKDLYESVLALSNEIKKTIEDGDFEEVENLLQKRENLLQKTSKNAIFSSEIEEIIAEIKSVDSSNLEKLKKHYQEIGSKLNSLSKNIFAVSSYKMFDNTILPIVDKRN